VEIPESLVVDDLSFSIRGVTKVKGELRGGRKLKKEIYKRRKRKFPGDRGGSLAKRIEEKMSLGFSNGMTTRNYGEKRVVSRVVCQDYC